MQVNYADVNDNYNVVADIFIVLFMAVILYMGVKLAIHSPNSVRGPHIDLSPRALPWYAFLSTLRMFAAYVLSMVFSFIYGYMAAKSKYTEVILIPLLDVLQSVPILSFLPVVLLSLSSILPVNIAAEVASVVLIFTSQVWNITFAWYQSLNTIPKELREASNIFSIKGWLKSKTLDLPFSIIPLVWNSMMSWAGGWFFLMAAEIFTVGNKDFRLPGLGSYLQATANKGDVRAVIYGIIALVIVIIVLDQLVWRPLFKWSYKFKLETVESDEPPASWFYDMLVRSKIANKIADIAGIISDKIDMLILLRKTHRESKQHRNIVIPLSAKRWVFYIFGLLCVGFVGFYTVKGLNYLKILTFSQWFSILKGVVATFIRVNLSLLIALIWTIPVGVAIGTNKKIAQKVQPIIQILSSIPATALFPALLMFILKFPGGINTATILLMLMGTQWYLLFNVIAGAVFIPQDLKYTAEILKLSRFQKWRYFILPAIFPYVITGLITAGGGAWNASIVAEYISFGGKIYHTTGIGSLITYSTAKGNYPLLLASTVTMIVVVVFINRVVWRSLYKLSKNRFTME